MTKTELTMSPKGIEVLKGLEGLSLKAYQDGAGIWTVGYGHTAGVGPKTTLKNAEAAHTLLLQDIALAEAAVRRNVKVELKQHEFDALVSFVFNLGPGALARSTLLLLLNAGDKRGAAKEFPRWRNVRTPQGMRPSNGLIRRRAAEVDMFLHGRYSSA